MKISCKIIEDLLPLYIDKVCSEESKKTVEEHLAQCSKCSEKFNKMKGEFMNKEKIDLNIKEAESIINLSKTWNKKLLLARIKGIISTLLVVGVILLIIYIFVGFKIS